MCFPRTEKKVQVLDESVYAVPVIDEWLIHAPLHGVDALVNAAAIESLQSGRKFKGFSDPVWKELCEKPEAVPSPPAGPLKPMFLGLIPTRRCNLNCIYCGFNAGSEASGEMEPSLALKMVEWMVDHALNTGMDSFEIHFFGGEPFCAPSVVDLAVHKARQLAHENHLICRFEADTNGFFDESRCRFVGDYMNRIVLSFDGPKAVHDFQRPTRLGKGSYERVQKTASMLGVSPALLSFRVCVTDRNVMELERMTKWFCSRFRPLIIDFEPLKPTEQSHASGLRPPDPFEFARHLIHARQVALSSGVSPVYSAADIHRIQHTFCPLGRDAVIVTPEGRLNGCYLMEEEWQKKGMNLNMGTVDTSAQVCISEERVNEIRAMTHPDKRKRCRKCIAQWHCAGGCHVMNRYANELEEYDDFCIQTRLITLCLILENLGYSRKARQLLEDRKSAERVARHVSDLIKDNP